MSRRPNKKSLSYKIFLKSLHVIQQLDCKASKNNNFATSRQSLQEDERIKANW